MYRARKKITALLLAACLALLCVPVVAQADDNGASLGPEVTFIGGTAYTDVKMRVTDGFSVQMTPDFAANTGEISRNKMTLQAVPTGHVGTVTYSWTRVELNEYREAVTDPEPAPGADDGDTYLLYEQVGTLRKGAIYEYRVTATDEAGNTAQASTMLVISDDYATFWMPDQDAAPKLYGFSIHKRATFEQREYEAGTSLHTQLQNLAGSGLLLAGTAYCLDVTCQGAVPYIGSLDVYLPVERAGVSTVTVVGLDSSGKQVVMRDLPVLEDGTVKITSSYLGAFAVAYPLSDFSADELATVTATSGWGGAIDPPGKSTYVVGQDASFVVFPDDGYVVDSLTVDGASVQLQGNAYTFEGISAGEHSIHVTFSKVDPYDPGTGQLRRYGVTAQVEGGNGLVMLDDQGPSELVELTDVVAGTAVQVQFVADRGYHVESVTVQVGNGQAYPVTVFGDQFRLSAVTGDTLITVRFAEGEALPVLTHTVIAEVAAGNGQVYPVQLTVPHGGRAAITVQPDEGWRVLAVTENVADAKAKLSAGTLLLQAVLVDTVVKVEFADYYELSATWGRGGSVDPEVLRVPVGGTAEFNLVPWAGYAVDSVVLTGTDGTELDVTAAVDGNKLMWPDVHDDYSLHAEFRALPPLLGSDSSLGEGASSLGEEILHAMARCKLTIGCSEGGQVQPEGEMTVTIGTSMDISLEPDPGYMLSSLTVNGQDVAADVDLEKGKYRLEDIRVDTVVYATFVPDPNLHKITASVSGSGGTVSPEGDVFVRAGSDCVFRFYPEAGYSVASVAVDGEALSYAPDSYTFTEVDGPHSLEVSFALSQAVEGVDVQTLLKALVVALALAVALLVCLLARRRKKEEE